MLRTSDEVTREELRQLRIRIGRIEVRSNDGWRVRAEALTILFNEDARLARVGRCFARYSRKGDTYPCTCGEHVCTDPTDDTVGCTVPGHTHPRPVT